MTTKPFNIRGALLGKQAQLLANHAAIRAVTGHPGTLGDQGERDWVQIFQGFLPERYEVGPIFAVDSTGAQSQQIDVAVVDRQYSPLWFGEKDSVRFVPVEAVYAVFEAKPTMSKTYVEYAVEKVASVRTLKRTSAPIIHAGGRFRAVDPADRPIIGGILTTSTAWAGADATTAALTKHLPGYDAPGFLNIGIALDTLSFDYTPTLVAGADTDTAATPARTIRSDGNQLIHFAVRLFRLLQLTGTVLAIDMAEYEQHISPPTS